jgi:hypothetical protein
LPNRGSVSNTRSARVHWSNSPFSVDYTIPLQRIRPVVALDVFNLFIGGAVTNLKTEVNHQFPDYATTLFAAPRLRQNPRNIRLYVALKVL